MISEKVFCGDPVDPKMPIDENPHEQALCAVKIKKMQRFTSGFVPRGESAQIILFS